MNEGNTVVTEALRAVRREANWLRGRGYVPLEANAAFSRGLAFGQIIIAMAYLDADTLPAHAAQNECRFLLGPYLNRSKS